MARRVGPRKVQRYSLEFKLKAVKFESAEGRRGCGARLGAEGP